MKFDDYDPEDLVGKRLVDPDGYEIGFVEKYEDGAFVVGEGWSDTFVISEDLFDRIEGDDIILRAPIYELFRGFRVYDADEKYIGRVVEVIEAGDTLDTIIVRTDIGEDDPMPERKETGEGEGSGKGEEGNESQSSEDIDPYDYILLEQISDIEDGAIYLWDTLEEVKAKQENHSFFEAIVEKINHIRRMFSS